MIDSVYTVRDSVTKAMLGERYTVYAAKLRIRDLYQADRWFEARPQVIYANGQPVASTNTRPAIPSGRGDPGDRR